RPKTDYFCGISPNTVVIADLNNDSNPDVIVGDAFPQSICTLLGDGTGGLASAVEHPLGQDITTLATGDLNDDGNVDIVAASNSVARLLVLPGLGNGTFGSVLSYSTGGSQYYNCPYAVAISDLNGDGRKDVVIASYNERTVSVMLGQGNQTLGPKTS